jgi:hypothetical protein
VLLYWHEQGPIQQHVAVSAKRIGRVPEKLNNVPELRWGLQMYWEAFGDLDTERNHGMGWMYIPWSSIVRYAEFYELDDEQTDRLLTHIQAMDRAYVKQLIADADAKKGK